MITHKIKLYGYTAELVGESQLVLGTVDSYGIEQIEIEIGGIWSGLVLFATFHYSGTATKMAVDSNGVVEVPPQATQSGNSASTRGKIVFHAVSETQQAISTDIEYRVYQHSDVDGNEPLPPDTSWNQIIAQAGAARDEAVQAASEAKKSLEEIGDSVERAEAAANRAEQVAGDVTSAGSAEIEKIKQAGTDEVNRVKSEGDVQVKRISEEGNAASGYAEQAKKYAEEAARYVSDVSDAANQAVSDINASKQTAITQISSAGSEQISNVQSAGNAVIETIESEKNVAVQAVKDAQTTGVNAVQAAQTAGVKAVNAAGDAKIEQIEQINALVPTPTPEDAGKVPTVNDAGTGYELRSTLEKNISDYYAMRRTGKVYQTRLWKFAANPTSAGEKLLDNAGLVFEPSTDTEEGQDDYLNGQNPLFEWVNVNYIRDDDGAPRPTAIEGQAGFKTSGAVDVGTMQMSFWYKIDASGEDYIDYYVSDTPHPELGLVPWPECVKADGTVLPWCIGSKYISGEASDGLPRSQPGLKPIRNVSHNLMITAYQQKGSGYWGAGAVRNTFQILFNAIKGATKSSQTLYAGTTSYNFQCAASVQREEKATYFPVTNSQANNIIAGAYVSVGYGSNNNGAVNNDRSIATIHSYADDVKVLRIEDLDENNKAVYLDIEDGFDTMPVALTDSLSAPIMLSSMHWWSGTTDSVRGHHDGSPGSNTDSKHPYRVQGREYAVGGYLVASDTVAWLNEDGTRTVYAAPRSTAHSANPETIQSTYRQIGTIPLNSSGSVSNYWVGDAGIDEDTGVWYPSAHGGGSTQGCADMYYYGEDAANSFREYLQCGNLWNGSVAGSCHLALWNGLGGGDWYSLAGD